MKKEKEKINRTLIGGQALMEGVMMRGATSMAMAVRTEDGEILTETKRIKGKRWYSRVPILRGLVAFFNSLVSGTGTLIRSSEVIYPEEETPSRGAFAVAGVLGVVLAIAIFILLPSFAVSMLMKLVPLNVLFQSLIEGGLRIIIFVLYLLVVSRMKDIRRTFMYHGAEHRTINCFEKGKDLTVENVQSCSTRHNRCGTTFLFFVIIVSILIFSLVTWLLSVLGWNLNTLTRMGVRLLLLPFVAGLSYELLRFLALLPDNKFVDIFRAPGLALQRLTTYPPEDDMAEIAIISFSLVYEMDRDPSIQPHSFGEFTIQQLRERILKRLKKAGIDEEAEADWILCEGLGVKRSALATFGKTDYKQYRKVMQILARREKGEPLDYITGKSYFYGLELSVNDKVLIPRLDTEVLADEAIKYIKANECKTALDLMTGSGCIAKAIAENTTAKVTASDISQDALEVAKTNLGDKVETILSDCFTAFTDEKYDIIVSNPPYIRTKDIDGLAKEVKCQPMLALDGGEDGLDIYRKIATLSPKYLTDGGMLMLEIGYDQREEVTALLSENFTEIECIKDLCGNDRVIKAKVRKL